MSHKALLLIVDFELPSFSPQIFINSTLILLKFSIVPQQLKTRA
jgi:hypothetical protein